ncbi:hypothetical protein THAOC_18759, partial [Thalassiosira oceanica]
MTPSRHCTLVSRGPRSAERSEDTKEEPTAGRQQATETLGTVTAARGKIPLTLPWQGADAPTAGRKKGNGRIPRQQALLRPASAGQWPPEGGRPLEGAGAAIGRGIGGTQGARRHRPRQKRRRRPTSITNGSRGGAVPAGDSSSQVQAEAAAAADLDYQRYDPQGRHYMQMLLGRLRLEGEANGRGAGRVNVERAWYFLEASAGNLALASDLYWDYAANEDAQLDSNNAAAEDLHAGEEDSKPSAVAARSKRARFSAGDDGDAKPAAASRRSHRRSSSREEWSGSGEEEQDDEDTDLSFGGKPASWRRRNPRRSLRANELNHGEGGQQQQRNDGKPTGRRRSASARLKRGDDDDGPAEGQREGEKAAFERARERRAEGLTDAGPEEVAEMMRLMSRYMAESRRAAEYRPPADVLAALDEQVRASAEAPAEAHDASGEADMEFISAEAALAKRTSAAARDRWMKALLGAPDPEDGSPDSPTLEDLLGELEADPNRLEELLSELRAQDAPVLEVLLGEHEARIDAARRRAEGEAAGAGNEGAA